MKTTTLDSARRGVFPPPFEPGDVLERQVESRDVVRFVRQRPAEVREGKVKKIGGKLFLDERLDRGAIRAAIRADRDAR